MYIPYIYTHTEYNMFENLLHGYGFTLQRYLILDSLNMHTPPKHFSVCILISVCKMNLAI